MKTPDEVKKGLECCNTFNVCHKCPYEKAVDTEHGWGCVVIRNADALAYIQQLERERDAAVEDCIVSDENYADLYWEAKRMEAAAPKWISVEDELPEVVFEYPSYKRTEYVVAISKDGVLHVGRFYIYKYDGSFEFISGYERFDATHWLPMPEPPEEERNV